MDIRFTLQNPKITQKYRRQFDRHNVNRVFVKWLYRRGYLDKYAHIFNIKRAERGLIPHGFDIHHIVPLAGGGKNFFPNLCLMERSLHKFINRKCFEPALRNIREGEERIVELPDFPPVALRREYNAFIDQKMAHMKDKKLFYKLLRRKD